MKIKSNLSRIKSNPVVARRVKKTKRSAKISIESEVHLRRSSRISERQLRSRCSLPDSDDSENEADDGAYQELLELSDCEDNTEWDSISEHSGEDNDDANMSDDALEDVEHDEAPGVSSTAAWCSDTKYFDNMDKTFTETPHVIGDIGPSEIDYFETIFDHRILSHIVTETNRYAQQNKSKNWSDVTADEMKAFIGCLIVMGIHQLPALKHYWSSDPFLRVESVATVMTANRFKKIIENLHCNDNETQPPKSDPNFDKQHKVKPLVELLNENVRKVYKPSGVVTVDESMIPFKGRYVLKQYMPKKPVKWGYKVWCLCDSYTGQLKFLFPT